MTRRGFIQRVAELATAAMVLPLAKKLAPAPFFLGPGTYVLDRPLELGDDARLYGCTFIMRGDAGRVHVVGNRVTISNCRFLPDVALR